MKNAVTPAEHQINLWCNVLSIMLPSCFSTLLLYITACNTFLHDPQKATLVLTIHLAHGCISASVALSSKVQKSITIVRASDARPGSLQGIAIIFAAVVTCLHHDTASIC